MGFNVDDFNQAKSKMLGEFNKAFMDTKELREAESAVFDMSSEAAPAAAGETSQVVVACLAGAILTTAIAVAGK